MNYKALDEGDLFFEASDSEEEENQEHEISDEHSDNESITETGGEDVTKVIIDDGGIPRIAS